METLVTPQNVMFVLGLLGVLFSVYHYFRNPQIKTDQFEAVFKVQFDALQAQVTNLRDNHIHTLDMKIDETNRNVAAITTEVARLTTVIEERIPKRR